MGVGAHPADAYSFADRSATKMTEPDATAVVDALHANAFVDAPNRRNAADSGMIALVECEWFIASNSVSTRDHALAGAGRRPNEQLELDRYFHFTSHSSR